MIAQYLASHSFLFRPKTDILDKRRDRNAQEIKDEEEEDPASERGSPSRSKSAEGGSEDEGGGGEATEDEGGGEEATDDDDDDDNPRKQPSPPRRSSSRKKRSVPSKSGADAQAKPQGGRKSQRLQKEGPKADSSTCRPKRKAKEMAGGSGAGDKVCLTFFSTLVLPSSYHVT
jgi:hypothetical protein